jgi:predicted nucleic acid-binding Zn ribbon protein
MVCSKCGYQVNPNEASCRNCGNPLKPHQKRKKWIGRFSLGCLFIIILLILLIVAMLFFMNRELKEAPAIVQLEQPKQTSFTPYNLSNDQIQSIHDYGYPDSFSILFYRQSDANHQVQDIRLETWLMMDDEIELTFLNGTLTESEVVNYHQAPYHPAEYRPELFSANMTLNQVLTAAGVEEYLVVPLEDELLKDSEVYYTGQLMFGLKDNQLRYIETVILEEAP